MHAQLKFNQRQNLPVILQDERADCGHACIAMISNFWGHQLDLYAVKNRSKTSVRGISLLDISEIFEGLGFMTRALKVPLEELDKVKCPAILHWNMNHFVVLKQVKKNYVVIHDPASGAQRYSLDEVSQAYTGIVLEVGKSDDFSALRSNNRFTLSHLFRDVHGLKKIITLLMLLSLSMEFLNLLNPLFIQYVTDNVIGLNELSNLYVIAFGFGILAITQAFVEYIRANMVIYLSSHLREQLSSNIVKHILKLPMDFFEKRHKSDIQTKFQTIDQIQNKISVDFVNAVLDGLMILINFFVMYYYSGLLATLVIFIMVITVAIRYVSYHYLQKQTQSSIHQHTRALTVFLETLQSIISIKSFLKERARFNLWRNCNINALNADIKIAKVNVIYRVAEHFLSCFEHIIVVCIGASFVLANKFSAGMLMAFLSYRLLFVNKAYSFLQNLIDYKLISIQLGRLSDILFQQPEVLTSGTGNPAQVTGALMLKNISYSYNNAPVIAKVSINIKAGEKIAITGSSGCGKSTLLKVMTGLLDSASGDIYIDGIPIRDFGLKNYRELTATVMQDDSLVTGSILDNISFFDENTDFEQVYASAKMCHIHDTICTFPMGYETLIGEMGASLSGGQKQRILLARALYKKPKILFLDEATSHLDEENEKKINESLKALEITQVVVAHRKETIQMADRVINLEQINKTTC